MDRKTFEGLTYYTNLRINIEKVHCSERVIRKVLYWEELGSVEEPTGTVTPFVVLMNTRYTRGKRDTTDEGYLTRVSKSIGLGWRWKFLNFVLELPLDWND